MGLLRSCFARTQTCLQPGKQTKGQLAIDILGDADADGLTFDSSAATRSTALLRERADAQAPPPARPDAPPPAEPGLIPLTVREVRRLLAAALETFNGGGDRLVW